MCVCVCVCLCVRFIYKTNQTVSISYIRGFILSAALQLSVRLTLPQSAQFIFGTPQWLSYCRKHVFISRYQNVHCSMSPFNTN